MSVLILTNATDAHADAVATKLDQKAVPFIRFDPASFPVKASLTVGFSGATSQYELRPGDRIVDLDSVTAVWYRRPRPPTPHRTVHDRVACKFVRRESEFVLNDVWHSLDCLWVPGFPYLLLRAEMKALQLRVASRLGFEVPPTLLTNRPEEFIGFFNLHGGHVVSKLASSALAHVAGSQVTRYCEVVSHRAAGYAHTIRLCPSLFQAYVPKKIELRVTVVGKKVFAAAIDSQASLHARHDWRRYDHRNTQYRIHELAADVARQCVALVEYFGLCFGVIDLILTPAGSHVFLELNPNGQYLWIEEATGLPISGAICELLASGRSSVNALAG